MRSKLIHVYDFREADISPFRVRFEVDQSAVDKELEQMANRKAVWEPAQQVQAGDTVECRLVSDVPRLNREQVKFVVGQKLFHPALEQKLIGLICGEKHTLDVDGVQVEAEIRSILRKVVPPITDELVQGTERLNCSVPGTANTVEEYRALQVEQQKEDALREPVNNAVQFLMQEVHDKSEILIAKEDWEHYIVTELNRHRRLAEMEGLKLETMTAEDFNGRIPVSSFHELVALMQDYSWGNLEHYMLGKVYAQEDGVLATEEGYEEHVAEFAEYWGLSDQIAHEVITRDGYEYSYYDGYFYRKVYDYVRSRILIED